VRRNKTEPPKVGLGVRRSLGASAKKKASGKSEATAPPITSNDKDVIVPVWMRLSDRDEIFDSQIGARVKMSGLVVGQKRGNVKITGIKIRPDDDSGISKEEWA